MTLSDLASLGSFVSGLAVVVTLVFLVMQMRQTNKNQKALMQQGRADRVSQATLQMTDADLAQIYARGRRGDESLSAEEFERFLAICRSALLSGEDSFLQHRSGQLDDAAYASYLAGVRSIFTSPGLRAAWRVLEPQFGAEFRAFMDDILNTTNPAPGADARQHWLELLRKEKTGRVES